MSDPAPIDSPWFIAVFSAAWCALGGALLYLLKLIRQTETDSRRNTDAVKHDLAQAVITAATIRDREASIFRMEMDARFQQMDARFNRGDTDRDTIREENQRNHAENAGRLDRIMVQMSNLATRADLQDLRGVRHDTGN